MSPAWSLAMLLAASAAAAEAPPPALVPGVTVSDSLAPGETDRFSIMAAEGQFVRGFVEQDGLAVRIALVDPKGRPVRAWDGVSRGKRRFGFVAEAAGAYQLVLTPEAAERGGYRLALGPDAPGPSPVADGPGDPLLRALAGGVIDADRFWAEAARSGTPRIAPLEDGRFRVTFLWRGAARQVQLVWALRREPAMLSRVPGTDVWYRDETLPRGTRFTYRLAPDAPEGRGGEEAAARMDPLDPRTFQESVETDPFSLASLAELPGAAPQPWADATGAPAGRVERRRFASAILSNDREIAIYTPPGYRADGPPLPLVVLFDAEAYLGRIPTPLILDNLIAAGRIPPTLAVLVANSTEENRNAELAADPKFAAFVGEELLPWVQARYPVTPDPARRVVGGSSLGGLAAGFIALERPDRFGAVLAQSGSFWWSPGRSPFGPQPADPYAAPGWLVHDTAAKPRRPVAFYLDAGWFEGGEGGGILDTNRYFRDVLVAKGYDVTWREFVGGHDYVNWRGTLADGLIALLGPERRRPG